MKAVVTGAAGFIGSRICQRLLRAPENQVVGIDSLTDYYDVNIKRLNLDKLRSPKFAFAHEDLTRANLHELIDGADVIFHQAGQPGVRKSWGQSFNEYIDRNIAATQMLLEACKGSRALSRFVYASSSSVYGDAETYPTDERTLPAPRSPYGVTKLAAEHLCGVYAGNFDVPTVSLRYFTVYGPGQRPDMAFTRFCKSAVEGSTIEIYGDGQQIRDFTYVDDIVSGNILAALSQKVEPGQVLNLAGGSNVSINHVLDLLRDIAATDLDVKYSSAAMGDVRRTSGSIQLARDILDWTPQVELADGLRAQFEWAREAFGAAGLEDKTG